MTNMAAGAEGLGAEGYLSPLSLKRNPPLQHVYVCVSFGGVGLKEEVKFRLDLVCN
jgi:hypothetical protein